MSGIKGWERAVPIKRPDNLCATNFTQKAFIPSYEKQYCRPDMNLVVCMEYRRLWFEERAAWQIEAYPKLKKESVMKNLEDKWRERIKDKVKGKTKGKENNGIDKKKPKNKYRNAVSKTDSGLGYVPSPSQASSPCRQKAAMRSAQTERLVLNPEDVKIEPPEMGSLTSQNSRNSAIENEMVQGEGSFMNPRVDNSDDLQLTEDLYPPKQQLPQGNELVAKCPRCATFHPLREKCPAIVLCKDRAFRERIMRNMC